MIPTPFRNKRQTCGGADRRQDAGAARNLPRHRGLDTIQPQRIRSLSRHRRCRGETGFPAPGPDDPARPRRCRHGFARSASASAVSRSSRPSPRVARGSCDEFDGLCQPDRPFTSEANANPIMTLPTTISHSEHAPRRQVARQQHLVLAASSQRKLRHAQDNQRIYLRRGGFSCRSWFDAWSSPAAGSDVYDARCPTSRRSSRPWHGNVQAGLTQRALLVRPTNTLNMMPPSILMKAMKADRLPMTAVRQRRSHRIAHAGDGRAIPSAIS